MHPIIMPKVLSFVMGGASLSKVPMEAGLIRVEDKEWASRCAMMPFRACRCKTHWLTVIHDKLGISEERNVRLFST
jgi:hypothetical protein